MSIVSSCSGSAMDSKKSMHDRIEKRIRHLQSLADRLHRLIDKGILGGEEARLWLDQWTVGIGYNIACGDFIIGESWGVDGDTAKIAPDVLLDWQHVPMEVEVIDHIVTNYLECFSDPMRTLEDWHARLKPGGIVAIVARDVDAYKGEPKGPLSNRHRRSCFSMASLKCYLEAVGFTVIREERWERELRVAARK